MDDQLHKIISIVNVYVPWDSLECPWLRLTTETFLLETKRSAHKTKNFPSYMIRPIFWGFQIDFLIISETHFH